MKMRYRITLTILFFITLSLGAMPATVLAKETTAAQILSISPIIINVPLSPGKTYTKDITIQNMTDNPLPLQASLNDFQTTGEEGGYIFEENRTNPLLSWISLSNTDLILNPKETKKVQITIRTPKEIPLGGYYGMLFFEAVPQSISTDTTRIVPKIGVLMLANIGVPDPNAKKAEILTYSTDLFHMTNHIPFLLRVKNISLHFFTAKPIVTISPFFSLRQNTISPIYLEEKIIFQGNVRRWNQQINLPNALPNIYKAHLEVATGDGQDVTQETYFVLLPSGKFIGVIIIFIFLILLISCRKRLGKAFKEFVK